MDFHRFCLRFFEALRNRWLLLLQSPDYQLDSRDVGGVITSLLQERESAASAHINNFENLIKLWLGSVFC